MSKVRRLLVVRFSSLGDVAMTIPVIKRVLDQNPTISITLVSDQKYEGLIQKGDRFSFIGFPRENFGFIGYLFFLIKNVNQPFDLVIDLHGSIRSVFLSYFYLIFRATIFFRIQKGRREKKKLCENRDQKKLTNLPSTFIRYAMVFQKAGIDVDLNPNSTQEKNIGTENKEFNYIGFAPLSRYDSKNLPLDLSIELIEKILIQFPSCKVLIFCSKQERKLLDSFQINERIQFIADLHLSLEKELSWIKKISLMISMDSANGHLASLFDIPCLTLWGSTHPCLGFQPWNQPNENQFLPDLTLYSNLPSSVNGSVSFENAKDCMRSIDINAILKRMGELLVM